MKIQDEAENRVINPEVVSEGLVQSLNEAMAECTENGHE